MKVMGVPKVRLAQDEDAAGVVELYKRNLDENNVWTEEKWRRYYAEYPEGTPYVIVAEDEQGVIVGHLSLLPNLTSTGQVIMMQSHVLVDKHYRNGDILNLLLEQGQAYAREQEVALIIAFTAYPFSKVLQRLYRWKVLGHLPFVNEKIVNRSQYANRIQFVHGDDWYRWRFDMQHDAYVFSYKINGDEHKQVWKTYQDTTLHAENFGEGELNCWCPESYTHEKPPEWSLSLVAFPVLPIPEVMLDIDNWYIEIGDSDIHWHPTS